MDHLTTAEPDHRTVTPASESDARYEVVNIRTRECFGNHTRAEAVTRARIMEMNWQYRERFVVMPRQGA